MTNPNIYFKIDYSGPLDDLSSGDQGTADYATYWNNASLYLSHDGADQTSVSVHDHTIFKGRVTNLGDTIPGKTTVQAWVFLPFVGPTAPKNAITAIGEDQTQTDALPDGAPIGFSGSAFGLVHGNPDSNLVAASTSSGAWDPSSDELSHYGGHLCLVANVYNNDEGHALDTDENFAPTSYDDAAGHHDRDAHHAQRNIALLPSAEPKQAMPFQVHPPLLQGQPTLLDIHALGSTDIGAGEHWLLQSRTNVTKINNRRFVIPGFRGKPPTALSYSRKGLRGSLSLETFGEVDLAEASKATKAAMERSGGSSKVPFRAWQDGARIRLQGLTTSQTATITLQRDDAKGSLQAFDIVQRTEDGRIVGGLRMLSLVTGALR